MSVVFSIQKGIIVCHKFTKKLQSGYRLENGDLLKGEKPRKRVGLDSLDVITVTEDKDEALKFSKQETRRMYDLLQVSQASRDDVEHWDDFKEGGEGSLPKSRIV